MAKYEHRGLSAMKTIHFTVLALAASALHSAELNHLPTADPPAGSELAQVRQLEPPAERQRFYRLVQTAAAP
jgi:hypothetical protein